jgi:hypothetical protein
MLVHRLWISYTLKMGAILPSETLVNKIVSRISIDVVQLLWMMIWKGCGGRCLLSICLEGLKEITRNISHDIQLPAGI